MKKVISIIMFIVMLASGLYISIDHHYCGGDPAGVKISLSGKLASCGMERTQHENSQGTSLDRRCCDDHLTVYNYSPDFFQTDLPSHSVSMAGLVCFSVMANLTSVTPAVDASYGFFPPGWGTCTQNTLSKTCILRI